MLHDLRLCFTSIQMNTYEGTANAITTSRLTVRDIPLYLGAYKYTTESHLLLCGRVPPWKPLSCVISRHFSYDF